jgi:hypothetical protein
MVSHAGMKPLGSPDLETLEMHSLGAMPYSASHILLCHSPVYRIESHFFALVQGKNINATIGTFRA